MSHKIENTERMVDENPMRALMTALPGGIEASELRGQQQLLQGDTLPTDTRGEDAKFIALGFTFGEPAEGDPMFRAATLPQGWKRAGSSHAMWSHIVDERGLKRVAIFYKAAFYDRSAHMGLENVGGTLASDAIYGDQPITPELLRLAILTPEERADFRASLDRTRTNIETHPDIYGKYAARLTACDAALVP